MQDINIENYILRIAVTFLYPINTFSSIGRVFEMDGVFYTFRWIFQIASIVSGT